MRLLSPLFPAVFPLLFLLGLSLSAQNENPFAAHVRPTNPLSPEEQERSFTLPEGFKINLFASEPQINKPLNMAFDGQGRLWVTSTVEYPYLPKDRPGRDAIKVLEDADGDGKADKVTTFADGLAIPMGLLPYGDGVITYSAPYIWYMRDTDGDGEADKREVLYGPMGQPIDTHGMQNAFRRGFDNWIYIAHGFNNTTTIKGDDGSEIQLHSGNTYRVRPDGSRVEQHTWGQVNPFGLCFDRFGNLYSADCHSSPIYQLIPGAYYPSFGKPHDGLGFGPVVMRHSHGSTAISGIVHYSDNLWPAEYRDNTFVGNVMTSRVNRDQLKYAGTSPTAHKRPDFVGTSDPWFRPVDIQLGPDGALYVADFYNRIIGHYEVPLDHDGRDRTSGRIWRITYVGDDGDERVHPMPINFPEAETAELIEELSSPNLTRRMLAMHALVDRGEAAVSALAERVTPGSGTSPIARAHALRALASQGKLSEEAWAAAANARRPIVAAHAFSALAEMPEPRDPQLRLARRTVQEAEANPHVLRAAVSALTAHLASANVWPLLTLYSETPGSDDHLRHAIKVALKRQFQADIPLSLDPLTHDNAEISGVARELLPQVALAVDTPAAAHFLLDYLQFAAQDEAVHPSRDAVKGYLRHASRHLPRGQMDLLADTVTRLIPEDLQIQSELYWEILEGLQQAGQEPSPALRRWGAALSLSLLKSLEPSQLDWKALPIENMPPSEAPWIFQERPSADGRAATLISSLPSGGEKLTGHLRSKVFNAPRELSFYLAGHDGYPDKPAQRKNYVELKDAGTGETLRMAYPPRNDTAQKTAWDLSNLEGREVFLEVTDSDTGDAYAWLAIGRIEPDVLRMPAAAPREVADMQIKAVRLAQRLGLASAARDLAQLADSADAAPEARAAALEALLALVPATQTDRVVRVLSDKRTFPNAVRERAWLNLSRLPRAELKRAMDDLLPQFSLPDHIAMGKSVAASRHGAELLLTAIEEGKASPQLLQNQEVMERLKASGLAGAMERAKQLTEGLPPLNDQLGALVRQRVAAYDAASADIEMGRQLFATHCAACHQINGQGGLVGPQLDGIASRGLARVAEDILNPNTNVDQAFRFSLVTMKDGSVRGGMLRREEGEARIFADISGQEFSVPRSEIDSIQQTGSSLMPPSFGQLIPTDQFNDLLKFLLESE